MPEPKPKRPRNTPLKQAVAMQAVLYQDIMSPDTRPSDRAQLARAWDTLEERKRVLRGKPLPGSLKPPPPKPKGSLPREALPDYAGR